MDGVPWTARVAAYDGLLQSPHRNCLLPDSDLEICGAHHSARMPQLIQCHHCSEVQATVQSLYLGIGNISYYFQKITYISY